MVSRGADEKLLRSRKKVCGRYFQKEVPKREPEAETHGAKLEVCLGWRGGGGVWLDQGFSGACSNSVSCGQLIWMCVYSTKKNLTEPSSRDGKGDRSQGGWRCGRAGWAPGAGVYVTLRGLTIITIHECRQPRRRNQEILRGIRQEKKMTIEQ